MVILVVVVHILYSHKEVSPLKIYQTHTLNLFRAFLRRMAVKRVYRRRGIATRLLDEVIEFCTNRCLEGIELVTTECHYKVLYRFMFGEKLWPFIIK